jgi:hypothetical protein
MWAFEVVVGLAAAVPAASDAACAEVEPTGGLSVPEGFSSA